MTHQALEILQRCGRHQFSYKKNMSGANTELQNRWNGERSPSTNLPRWTLNPELSKFYLQKWVTYRVWFLARKLRCYKKKDRNHTRIYRTRSLGPPCGLRLPSAWVMLPGVPPAPIAQLGSVGSNSTNPANQSTAEWPQKHNLASCTHSNERSLVSCTHIREYLVL